MTRKNTLTIRTHPQVSVLIIGGGINGIGTFRDLALQGIDVLLVEKGDYCFGSSAASTRQAHGGLRYLEHGEFRLVRESLLERNRLLQCPPRRRMAGNHHPHLQTIFGHIERPVEILGHPKTTERTRFHCDQTRYADVRLVHPPQPHDTHPQNVKSHEALAKHPHLNPAIIGAATSRILSCPKPSTSRSS